MISALYQTVYFKDILFYKRPNIIYLYVSNYLSKENRLKGLIIGMDRKKEYTVFKYFCWQQNDINICLRFQMGFLLL